MTASAAGCVNGPDALQAASVEAPSPGAETLEVPPYRFGDGFVIRENETSFVVTLGTGDLPATIEFTQANRTLERRVADHSGTALDRFFQPARTVVVEERVAAEGAGNASRAMGAVEYDLETRAAIGRTFNATATSFEPSCAWVVANCDDGRRDGTVSARRYFSGFPVGGLWPLAGERLWIGKRVAFEQAILVEGGESSRIRHEWSVEGEERWNEQRVLVVSRTIRPTGHGELPWPGIPNGATHRVWVSNTSPMPLREESSFPLTILGKQHWLNSTFELLQYRPGADPVLWTGLSRESTRVRMEGAAFIPASSFIEAASERLAHPLAAAWNAVQGDLLLEDFQAFLEQYPDARPVRGFYVPDEEHHAYTWFLTVGDQGNCMYVDSRRQLSAASSELFVVQNREIGGVAECSFLPPKTEQDGSALVSLGDVIDAYRRLRPGRGDPALVFDLWMAAGVPEFPGVFSVGVFDVRLQYAGVSLLSGPSLFNYVWASANDLDFDLDSGALWGGNLTGYAFGQRWPWVPGIDYP